MSPPGSLEDILCGFRVLGSWGLVLRVWKFLVGSSGRRFSCAAVERFRNVGAWGFIWCIRLGL